MRHNTPDFRHRAQIEELMDKPCSREQLHACLRDIARTNRWTMAYRPLIDWLNALLPLLRLTVEPIRILDVGFGYGDTLRRIEGWAKRHRIHVELTGIDRNPEATLIASEASLASSTIHWVSADVFSFKLERPVHLVISSLFAHHLVEDDVVRFLMWMEQHTETGWFITDLQRTPTSYRFFRRFSKLTGLHPFVQHDGPVSIARSFLHEDWRRMCEAACINNSNVQIRSFRPSWLCVARRKLH
jgi:SAM-dependent methyltransferase